MAPRRRAARPPPFPNDWKPTPTRDECNRGINGNVIRIKAWDGSPIDPWSFDPTPPVPVAPPTNTGAPFISELTDFVVGSQLAVSGGTWTGSPTYTRQWNRAGAAIPGATAIAYTMVAADVGLMIGATVTGTNAGGSASADAAPVGPVEAAP